MLVTTPLFSQSSELELKSRNSIGFVIEGGVNTSRIVAKKWLGKDDIDYQMGYKPGYNWNVYLEFSHRRISLAAGIGAKSLNFNVTQHVIFSPPGGSKAIVQLNYWTLPVQIKVSLLEKDRLFITMTTEFSWLMNDLFGVINGYLAAVFFYDVMPGSANMPFIVAWLIVGAVFLTVRMGFINFRLFRHAYHILRGRYQTPGAEGEVSSFQALTTALSATVGLGNIAGVAIAVSVGGPGATFWMIIAGLLGMSSKFTECTLGVKYRKIDKNGVVSGGPMYYLSQALALRKMKWLGKILAVIFSVLVIGGSIGGGNMFQANQSLSQFSAVFPFEISPDLSWLSLSCVPQYNTRLCNRRGKRLIKNRVIFYVQPLMCQFMKDQADQLIFPPAHDCVQDRIIKPAQGGISICSRYINIITLTLKLISIGCSILLRKIAPIT